MSSGFSSHLVELEISDFLDAVRRHTEDYDVSDYISDEEDELLSPSGSIGSCSLMSCDSGVRTPLSLTNIDFNSADYVMGETDCCLTVLDVADCLQDKYAFISGGRARNGAPIITFPDEPKINVNDHQFQRVVEYLTSIPSLQEVDTGFVIIIDRRKEKWGSVKTILLRISNYFPAMVQEVLVLRPSGLFQKNISDIAFKLVKEDFSFPIVMLNSETELHSLIEKDELTLNLGGNLQFDAQEWINHRAAIEKFTANANQVGVSLRSLCKRLQDTEFPNDVISTEDTIQSHHAELQAVHDDLRSVVHHGNLLLECVHNVRGTDGQEQQIEGALLPPAKLTHVTCVERLLVQLEETDKNFNHFWEQHEKRLQQCLQLRKFEEEFKQVQLCVEQHLRHLEEMTDYGNSVQSVEALRTQLQSLDAQAQEDVAQAETLEANGQRFIDDDHYAVDCIRPKCIELQRMAQQYREMMRNRHEQLQRSYNLYERLDKAKKWCTLGTDLLSSQSEQPTSAEETRRSMAGIESFLQSANDLKLNNPQEFHGSFEGLLSPDNKVVVAEVLQRVQDVRDMCSRRRSSLLSHAASIAAAPRRREQSRDRRGGRRGLGWTGRRSQSADRARGRIEVKRLDSDSGASIDSESIPDSLSSHVITHVPTSCSVSDFETLNAKKSYVMRELVDTERVYVRELRDIIEGYCNELESPSEGVVPPPELVGRGHTLFGNIEELYSFHNNVFLKDLLNCEETPTHVGRCFVDRKCDFQLYSTYCQNKPASEGLQHQIGDDNPFFLHCQRRLGHRLPLAAYLLKPVQRVTKYQLLLKEMLKCVSDHDLAAVTLQEALSAMLKVLKHVNDVMHQIAIAGYPDDLTQAGRLLMQGSFTVWVTHKNKIKDLRLKPMQRHVFLYDKTVLFCKQKEDPLSPAKSAYIYKNSLKMADIGLTENVKGDRRKLELWVRGRSETYTLQAPSMDDKDSWVEEIKRVLMSQFDQIKERRKPDKVQPSSRTENGYESSPGAMTSTNSDDFVTPITAAPLLTSSQQSRDESYESDGGWSTDDWDEDHDVTRREVTLEQLGHVLQYACLADYNRVDAAEMPMREGDIVTLLRRGFEGWWFVKMHGSGEEGWVPASYLESLDTYKRKSSQSNLSFSSAESSGIGSSRGNTESSKSSLSTVPGMTSAASPVYNPLEETLV